MSLAPDPNNVRNDGANDANRQTTTGNSLQVASTPITGMGSTTNAPNRLPAPPATAGATMGSKPGVKDPAQPGIRRAF